MNIAQVCLIISLSTSIQLSYVYAQEVASLPSIQLMADEELRDEVLTTIQPFQDNHNVRQALQHQLIKKEQNIQNFEIGDHANVLNVQAQAVMPNLNQLSPLQQEYVLSVAAGLQSNDPSSGIFKMLEPLGINRENALNGVRTGNPLDMRFDEQQLNQLLGDQWRNGVKGN